MFHDPTRLDSAQAFDAWIRHQLRCIRPVIADGLSPSVGRMPRSPPCPIGDYERPCKAVCLLINGDTPTSLRYLGTPQQSLAGIASVRAHTGDVWKRAASGSNPGLAISNCPVEMPTGLFTSHRFLSLKLRGSASGCHVTTHLRFTDLLTNRKPSSTPVFPSNMSLRPCSIDPFQRS